MRLRELTRPFPDKYVHRNPSGGGDYVKHHVVEQRMLLVLGYAPNFELVQIVRGGVAAIDPNPNGKSDRARKGAPALDDVVVAVIARMTLRDGTVVEEAGDCEQPHNWDTDGQRLKDAMSDAYKRCAMRLGVGLHLWSGDEYFLFDKLSEDVAGAPHPSVAQALSDTSSAAPPQQDVGRGGGTTPVPAPAANSDDDSKAQLVQLIEARMAAGDLDWSVVRGKAKVAAAIHGQSAPGSLKNMSAEALRVLYGKLGSNA